MLVLLVHRYIWHKPGEFPWLCVFDGKNIRLYTILYNLRCNCNLIPYVVKTGSPLLCVNTIRFVSSQLVCILDLAVEKNNHFGNFSFLKSCRNFFAKEVTYVFSSFSRFIMMYMGSTLLIVLNIHVSQGGWPISDPTVAKKSGWPNVKQSAQYNLIDADPSCWYEGVCPMFPPGLHACTLSHQICFPIIQISFCHIQIS